MFAIFGLKITVKICISARLRCVDSLWEMLEKVVRLGFARDERRDISFDLVDLAISTIIALELEILERNYIPFS